MLFICEIDWFYLERSGKFEKNMVTDSFNMEAWSWEKGEY